MNRNYQNQLERLRKLYRNGKVCDISVELLETMSFEEREEFILKSEKVSGKPYEPLYRELRCALTNMIREGELNISPANLEFMSKDQGEKYFLLGKLVREKGLGSCSKRQCKRIRAMMRENYIAPIPEIELKMLSDKEADEKIRTAEEQITQRQIRRT